MALGAGLIARLRAPPVAVLGRCYRQDGYDRRQSELLHQPNNRLIRTKS
jgi:hypothetical protein